MFKVAVNEAFWAAVSVAFPTDAGKVDTRKFEVKFRRLSQSQLDEMEKQIFQREITDDQIARSVVLDWKGVQDENGAELPFNEDNLAKALDVNPVRPTIVKEFFKIINGARQKN